MKDSHEKGVAIHSAPSFALGVARRAVKRKQGNRWAGYRAPKTCNQDADVVREAEGNMTKGDSASPWSVRRSRRPQTRLETFCTRTGRPRGRLLRSGSRPTGEGLGHTARMYVSEESHSGIVPMNHSNNDGKPSAESAEGRLLVKENTHPSDTYPTQSGACVSQGLAGVRLNRR